MEKATLAIEGMSCGHCVNAVTNALRQMDGVRVEQVEIGRATVAYDPARADLERIVDAVNDEGYQAHASG